MRFEKWQALGNDYLIFEEVELTPQQIQRLCDPHFGPGADGVLVLTKPDEPGYVARLRIFNPDGSEAELSGNGAREAILYLRRTGWTERGHVQHPDARGRDPADDHRARRPAASTWAARSLTLAELPGRPAGRPGRAEVDGRTFRFQHVAIGNPQCAIRVEDPDALDLQAHRPADRARADLPQPHERLASGARSRRTRSARGSSSAAWGRRCPAAPGASGAAVAHVLRGGDSPVTVHLDGGELTVDVDESLHVDLTGWAVPDLPWRAERGIQDDMEAE